MPTWKEWLQELNRRGRGASEQGGADKVKKQHAAGRLTARERLDKLLDDGSFLEIGLLGGGAPPAGDAVPADGLIGGYGTIDGQSVLVMAEDFTVKGGSIGHVGAAKRLRFAELALQENRPFLMLLEGAGERADNALERYPRTPNDLQMLTKLKGRVPVVSVVLGASAGHGALAAVFSDYVIMTRQAALFSAGPQLVKAALGQTVTPQELGGAGMHATISGMAHGLAEDDVSALDMARQYIGYFCNRRKEGPLGDDAAKDLLDIIPPDLMQPYDMADVLAEVFDQGSVMLLQPDYGSSISTALARLDGQTVMVVASQPAVMGGAITREAAGKAAHFLETAGAFALPVVFLCDTPGVMPGAEAEQAGTLKASAAFYRAQAGLTGPKLHVTLRKAFGFGSSLMAMNPFDGQTMTLAFPNASLGAMPVKGGADAAGLDEAEAQKLAELSAGAWAGADNVAYDRVIDPRHLRDELVAALRHAHYAQGGAS
ncbi:MAG: acyl-CoA carboxylase subunit beta [Parvibaculales bacterium]